MSFEEPRRRRPRRALWLAALGLVAWGAAVSWRVGEVESVDIRPQLPAIGRATPIEIEVVAAGRGLAQVSVELRQGDRVWPLAAESWSPPSAWQPWRASERGAVVRRTVGPSVADGLAAGVATIHVDARPAGSWLRRPEATRAELELPVRLRPPSLAVSSTRHYLRQGGAEAVTYRVGPTSVRDGVQAGEWWFPGFPLPGGGDNERFALFAAPYDLEDADQIRLVASDDVGNTSRVAFVDRYTLRPPQPGRIELSEDFMARVVPPILEATPGLAESATLLESYLSINRELRAANARRLVELSETSDAAMHWRRPFLQLPGSSVMSPFAARRQYLLDGEVVDHQDHLGYDLASLRRAEVPAANDGKVALAEYFGIYGNAVVIDHGYGLASLYGHLSSIDVEPGQVVARGQTVGRTGVTGLAGGDHLHFSMLLQGLPVDPIEWWDGHWIEDRLATKLGAALTGSEGG